MTYKKTLIPALLFLLTVVDISTATQIKVNFPETTFTSRDLEDYNNLKLTINSKNKYIYPANKNIFTM